MTRRYRRVLFYCCVLVFLLISFTATIYAYGFKFDFLNFKLVKTSAVLIRTNIPGSVYIDDKLVGSTSFLGNTFSKSRLTPGEYLIKFQTDKYTTWSKNISLKAGYVLEYNHVLVIPQEFEAILVSSPSADVTNYFKNKLPINSISPDENKEFTFNQYELWIKWLNDSKEQPFQIKGNTELITRFSNKITNVAWYEDSNHLIASVGGIIKLVEIDNRGGINIFDIGPVSGLFYYEANSISIYFIKNKKYYLYSLK